MDFFINKAKAENNVGDSLDEAISTTATPVEEGNNAQQQQTKSAAEGGIMSFLPLIIMFTIFYFFLIRPQSKKQKQQQEMVNNLKAGDKVVTNSGIIGTIRKVNKDEKLVHLEIADNTEIKILKHFISELYNPQTVQDKEKGKKNEKTVEQSSS